YVSGISTSVAKNVVKYREKNGKFKNRKELLKVKRLGDKTFEQCAGFLRIADGTHPLDNTSVHPESYKITMELIEKLGYTTEDVRKGNLKNIEDAISEYTEGKAENLNNQIKILSEELDIGELTLKDIIEELKKPGRDSREEMPKPIFRSDVLDMEDLKLDMVMKGAVRNVVDFGAFVDIGVKQDGLVHISELSDKFIKNPLDVVSVGDEVEVKIIGLDIEHGKISLSMKRV
ncbi:MAG TPA: helix-hairpin-helix domain-containing protein, partial [Oscillospiraceae bacterium]|nr:helix-hairpin-helix domain-containing protein [Oscillospiraceae bacterium]